MTLAERVLSGDRRALARAISLSEDDPDAAAHLVDAVFGRTGRAQFVGITGPPGAGKSTLVDRLAACYRRADRTVGILAVDPSSPFSGGALLGDRVRMQALAGDAGVFVRSMATRGHLGGLARATADAAVLLDAAGYDVIVIETVGVGQDEVAIIGAADVSVVVLVPGAGDDVQALKAGVMEIADVFVVNKGDRDGVDSVVLAIESVMGLAPAALDAWAPPVLTTVATTGAGVEELADTIERFLAHDVSGRSARRRRRVETRIRADVDRQWHARLDASMLSPAEMARLVDAVVAGTVAPSAAAERVMARMSSEGA